MCDSMVHRGPDAYGEYFDTDVALGHRRLSIIDVEGGAQPLGNEDGSIQVVFNGEIYNFRELRQGLERRGHRIRTKSDTEVLVHLYEEEGERLPEKLNGMFAFAIWDSRRRRLFLARDRFGEKPLYYTSALPGLSFAFASELKALMGIPGLPKRVNPQSVSEFISNAYIADPSTIYRDVSRLRPGHSLTVSWDGTATRRYWAPSFVINPESRFSTSAERLQELASDAVKMRMMSEVPLGGFLSGGVDSSAVVACMAPKVADRIKTFTVGFTTPEFDERPYARMVAGRYSTDHFEFEVNSSVHEMLDRVADIYDEPYGDASAVPTLYLARLARQHVTVALSGDGADELLGGYLRYGRVLDRLTRSLLPPRFRRFGFASRWGYDHQAIGTPGSALAAAMSRRMGDEYHRAVSTISDSSLTALLAPELRASLGGYSPLAVMRGRFEPLKDLPLLLQMQAVDMETYLPADILVKMDRATMAYSLESRAPWLDHRLAEFAGALPPAFKLRGGSGKRILKHAFHRRLPRTVLTRGKKGFAVPLAAWFRTILKETFEERVLTPGMACYLELGEARRLWMEHQSGMHDDHSWVLWNLLALGLWHAKVK